MGFLAKMEFEKLQSSLAAQAAAIYKNQSTPLSQKVLDTFLKVPRHQFIERFRNFGDNRWHSFSLDTARDLLPLIYQDSPLILWGSDEDFAGKQGHTPVSTISQPSFVLRMLDLLDVQAGQKVFELGTASGWNAALLAELVGPTGQVVTAEIIPELADKAAQRLQQRGLHNTQVISGDGAFGDSKSTFDRVIFTAGAFDFPAVFFEQTKPGALVLFVLKNKGCMDTLYLLKRHEDYFESIHAEPCGFVSVTGSAHISGMEEKALSEFLSEHNMPQEPSEKGAFWWGSSNKGYFIGQTTVLRGYLSLFENYHAFILADGKKGFGWYDPSSNSLAIAQAGELLIYGDPAAANALKNVLKNWIDLGMPTLAVLNLRIYRSEFKRQVSKDAWISKRPQATFEWRLPNL